MSPRQATMSARIKEKWAWLRGRRSRRQAVENRATDDFCPYVGLRAYEEGDSDFFHGRSAEIQTITANLYASRLTILYGPSGAGKSSILQAGVIPNLKKRKRSIVVYYAEWQKEDAIKRLHEECGRQVQLAPEAPPSAKDSEPESEDAAAEADLRSDSEPASLDVLCDTERGTVYLILDQFEDYLLSGYGDGPKRFDAEVARCVNRRDVRVHMLIGIRQEDLSKLDRMRSRIPNLLSNTLRLSSLSMEGAREAVQGPIDAYNRLFPGRKVQLGKEQEDPVDTVCAGAKDKDGDIEASLIQLVMRRLWEQETLSAEQTGAAGTRQLRLGTLNDSLGGVQRLVARHLDEVMGELTGGQRRIAAAIFRELVSSKGDRVSRFISEISELIKKPAADVDKS